MKSRAYVATSVSTLALVTLLGCGGRQGASVATAHLEDDRAPPSRCEDLKTVPPKGAWEARVKALEAIGRATNAPEYDDAVVLDALSREVRSIADTAGCRIDFEAKPEQPLRYAIDCGNAPAEVKARASRIERAVREHGAIYLKTSKTLGACRGMLALSAESKLKSAAEGSIDAGKMTYKAAGCSYLNAASCELACDRGVGSSCMIAAAHAKDDARRTELYGKGCDAALASPSVEPKAVMLACGAALSPNAATPERLDRFAKRVCTGSPESPACWFVFDPTRAGYDAQRAKELASHVQCAGDDCPVALLTDPAAPHYDAARAEKVLGILSAHCETRDKRCFYWATAVARRPATDPVRRQVAQAVVNECESGGPHKGVACFTALRERSKEGSLEDLARAAALASRMCDESEHACSVAADCTLAGTCVAQADRARARGYYERHCAALVKLDEKKPRAEWPACKKADELAASP